MIDDNLAQNFGDGQEDSKRLCQLNVNGKAV